MDNETNKVAFDNTIVCRCEDLSLTAIRKAIADGYRTIDEIKRVTRAGMGPCQGRTCRPIIAGELSRYYKIPMEEVLMPTFRPPVKPVKLGLFCKPGSFEKEGGGASKGGGH